VIWTRKPSRPPVRALALATLALAVAGFSTSAASAATTVPKQTTSGSQLAELLRRLRQRNSATTSTQVPRANGAAPGGATAPGSIPAATTPPTATPAAASPPAQATAAGRARSGGGNRPLSTGAIVIAALAALLVLGCLAWAFARSRAFEPHWLITLRHSAAEAGFRVSSAWSELLDWARLGR
jgi:hypothetical protein